MKRIIVPVSLALLAACAHEPMGGTDPAAAAPKAPSSTANSTSSASPNPAPAPKGASSMQLGNFSVSLAVKDLAASKAFYEKLGFRSFGGDGKAWLIMQNETSTIGLFQGMFDKNILTFNPGWDRSCNTLKDFDDVRDIQKQLKAKGITPVMAADEASTGPASCVIVDPDGNQILLDQHVPKAAK